MIKRKRRNSVKCLRFIRFFILLFNGGKDSANRMQNKMNLFVFYAEMPCIFAFQGKDSANRTQNKMNLFIFYAKVQPIFAFWAKITLTNRNYLHFSQQNKCIRRNLPTDCISLKWKISFKWIKLFCVFHPDNNVQRYFQQEKQPLTNSNSFNSR